MINYKLLGFVMFFAVLTTSKAIHEHHKETSAFAIQALAHQAYTEDSNTIVFRTNNISLITDSLIEFNIYVEGVATGEPVDVVISNPDVLQDWRGKAAAKYQSRTGDRFRIFPRDFGRTAVTVIPTKSPRLRQSFAIYIEDLDLYTPDTVFNASIKPEYGDNFLDPLHNLPKGDGTFGNGFLKTHHLFTVVGLHKATEFAELKWEVINKGKMQHPTRISLNKRRDSATIYFSKGGNYTIYLKHKNNPKQSIIDSLEFSVNLPMAYTSDLKTGVLPYFIDFRDGQKYKLLHMEDPYRDGLRVVYMEHLRYLPYVSKLNTAHSGATTSPYIFVFGNNSTENPDLIRPQLSSNSQVVYNNHAALNLTTGITISNDDKYKPPIKYREHGIQGICPKGFYLPSDQVMTHYLAKDVTDFSAGYRNSEVQAFFTQGSQQNYRGKVWIRHLAANPTKFISTTGKRGRRPIIVRSISPLTTGVSRHNKTAPDLYTDLDTDEAGSVICVFSEWYHR